MSTHFLDNDRALLSDCNCIELVRLLCGKFAIIIWMHISLGGACCLGLFLLATVCYAPVGPTDLDCKSWFNL